MKSAFAKQDNNRSLQMVKPAPKQSFGVRLQQLFFKKVNQIVWSIVILIQTNQSCADVHAEATIMQMCAKKWSGSERCHFAPETNKLSESRQGVVISTIVAVVSKTENLDKGVHCSPKKPLSCLSNHVGAKCISNLH